MYYQLYMISLILLLLGAYVANADFPAGRCYEKTCNASPYEIRKVNSQDNKMCVRFSLKECTSPKYDCCNRFTNNLVKIVFPSLPICKNSVEMVTINGNKKGGGIYFDVYNGDEAELRITSLNINQNKALNATICVHLKGTCSTFESFCRTKNSNVCKYALFDPARHDCCPTCRLTTPNTFPPPPVVNSPPPPVVNSPAPPVPKSPPPPFPKSPPPPVPKSPPPPVVNSPPPPVVNSPPPPVPKSPPPKPDIPDIIFDNMMCNCTCVKPTQ